MKKIMTYLLGTMLSVSLFAVDGVIESRPGNDGKMMTMEEVFSPELYPENKTYVWRPESSALTFFENKSLQSLNPMEKLNAVLLSEEEIRGITGTEKALFLRWLDHDRAVFITKDTYYIIGVGKKVLEASFARPENGRNFTLNPAGLHPFTRDNGLYFCDNEGNTVPIATSADKNIIYGQTVSRNEFGISGGIFLSPDGRKLAFYRKDETAVGTFPLVNIAAGAGELVEIKYPMAGTASEELALGIYDFESGATVYADVSDFGPDRYLTNVSWSPEGRFIFIQVLDRQQKNLHLNMYDAVSGKFLRTLLTEHDDRYVEPQDPMHFLKGSTDRFIYRIDTRDGYRNLYLCDTDGSVERLTKVDADVQYVADDGRYVYYTSAEISPVENHLFRVDLKTGKTARLTDKTGWHNVSVSPDGKYFLDRWSSLCVPQVIDLVRTDAAAKTDGKSSGRGADRKVNLLTAADPIAGYAAGEILLGSIKSADGQYDNHYRMFLPVGFDPDKKYPVILYVYGGPHSQMVNNSWLANIRRWELYMAQRGYIVYIQDNRGTLNQGAEYEKVIHRHCGQAEMADQMEGIRMLTSLPYVDKDRIGVHGWSYGGFMTISLITHHPEIFKVAVAGGPVIDWKWYEVMYGERYMETPQANPEGYGQTSLISMAKNLKGKLLICQGAMDDVVVWEHCLSFISECIKNNVQVDFFPYPLAKHNVAGKDRVHLMNKVTAYFDDWL